MKTIAKHRHHAGPLLILSLILLAVVGQLIHHPVETAILGTVIAFASLVLAIRLGTFRGRRNRRARAASGFRNMDPSQFEHALAELCRRDGCTNVRVVGGKGDLAADVLATVPSTWWRRALRLGQQRILIQAKHHAPGNKVGSAALQAVNGTYRDVHKAHLAAVVTTSSFTTDALKFGKHVGIRCFDEHALAAWASQTGPAPWQ